MKTLIVYDSVFGNTEKIAQAMQTALAGQGEVELLRITDLKPEHLSGLGLLIVGSPTRGFRPTPALSAALKALPANCLAGVRAAAFDTRIEVAKVNNRILSFMVPIFGYAAKPIGDLLQKKGARLALPPEGFIVNASEGPLKDGELERAAQWAKTALS